MLSEKFGSALDVFKTKSPSLIGVDIASTSIKLIELSQTGKGTFKLERYAIETWFFAPSAYPDGQTPLVF